MAVVVFFALVIAFLFLYIHGWCSFEAGVFSSSLFPSGSGLLCDVRVSEYSINLDRYQVIKEYFYFYFY